LGVGVQDLFDAIAAVEAKKAEDVEVKRKAAEAKDLVLVDGADKTYKVKVRAICMLRDNAPLPSKADTAVHGALQAKSLKGKKVVIPGKKGKHTIPNKIQLTVGSMGLKLLDGERKLSQPSIDASKGQEGARVCVLSRGMPRLQMSSAATLCRHSPHGRRWAGS
jgi:hypothetical protein